eukprot:gnl/MRDRNA2_/MRDRNA2_133840_c0_seq1.p1 gnl/MRDRNA2_/MRDRNA2_133840_c0~~gnl/MRDRNA2_/MRDRNA2_133840_c0_seq1.p1  ORF type:complete len:509 (-),score=67.20 gnl/MRDRNA2_/MRDRNA2_133840_c0_seq1:115-1641(-)
MCILRAIAQLTFVACTAARLVVNHSRSMHDSTQVDDHHGQRHTDASNNKLADRLLERIYDSSYADVEHVMLRKPGNLAVRTCTRPTANCWRPQYRQKPERIMQFAATNGAQVPQSTDTLRNVIVIGGTGRVGGSALRAILHKYSPHQVKVSVGGRDPANWAKYKEDKALNFENVEFEKVDVRKPEDLNRIAEKYDLIVNTAGPFQGLSESPLLRSVLMKGKLYVDVCDDIALSRLIRSQEYQELARENKAKAIISTGIWPGVSSLFAQHLIEGPQCGGKAQVEEVVFSFYTAGSGGAGPTILSATFLILGEDVLTYKNGQEVLEKSATDSYTIDFGPGIGPREVARLNLIECESCHVAGVQTVSTFFGTAPAVWNKLFVLMANLLPQDLLRDRGAMDWLARFSLPVVRLVDSFVGSKNSIRIDVKRKDGKTVTGIISHEDMEKAVGDSIAAFVGQLLPPGSSGPEETEHVGYGIFFPEEVASSDFRSNILEEIRGDAIFYAEDYQDKH